MNLIWFIALQHRMFSVFMCVYIPLQLRSEKKKQTPVIENSPQITMVPVRTRRSVPMCWCVGMWLMCVLVSVYVGTCYAVPQLNPSSPSTSSLHAGMMLTVPAFLWTTLLLSTDVTLDRCSSQQQSVSQVHTVPTECNCFQLIVCTANIGKRQYTFTPPNTKSSRCCLKMSRFVNPNWRIKADFYIFEKLKTACFLWPYLHNELF